MPWVMISGVMLTMWGVAHAPAVDDVGHLHAAAEFVGLNFDGKDADLRAFHVVEHVAGHADERARRDLFEDEGVPGAAQPGEFDGHGGGDLEAAPVGDEGDFFVRLDAQAGGDGVVRAFTELRGKRDFEEVGSALGGL